MAYSHQEKLFPGTDNRLPIDDFIEPKKSIQFLEHEEEHTVICNFDDDNRDSPNFPNERLHDGIGVESNQLLKVENDHTEAQRYVSCQSTHSKLTDDKPEDDRKRNSFSQTEPLLPATKKVTIIECYGVCGLQIGDNNSLQMSHVSIGYFSV